MLGLHVVVEAVASLRREAKRVAPMAAGIVWGVASVFVLAAIGNGFERTQRQAIEAFGDSFMLLRLNKPAVSRGDPDATRRILLDRIDLQRMEAAAPAAAAISPKAFVWRARAIRGGETTWMTPVGVFPEYDRVCNVPLEPGSRWIDANDVANAHPVVVIGWRAKEELFGDEPAIGKTVHVSTRGFRRDPDDTTPITPPRPLTVIGVVRNVEVTDEFYVSSKSVGFIPYSLFERMSERGTEFLVVRPKSPDLKEEALAQMRGALADRYHFDPADANTMLPYFDAIERGRKIDRVFGGIRLFLGAVALLILLLGAVGVANVVLMSVTARTYEFGLRRALGCRRRWVFAQVFTEAALVCGSSGVCGFLLGLGFVALAGALPLPEGFATPQADLGAATLPGFLLLGVTLGAALWPASRAARLDPVVALRGGAL